MVIRAFEKETSNWTENEIANLYKERWKVVWVTKISVAAVRFLFDIYAKFTCTRTQWHVTIVNPFTMSQQFCEISQDIGIIA